MSDLLIKNMKMPTSCMDCPFKGFDRASGRGNICTIDESITLHAVLDGLDVKFVKMGDCPLIKVPPHGRLIDADKLRAEFPHPNDWRNPNLAYAHLSGIWATIDCAETIIEAEGGRVMRTMSGGPCQHFDCSNRNSFGYCRTTACINEHYQQEQWGSLSTTNKSESVVKKPQTNADRIRAMSDEELAKTLSGEEIYPWCTKPCEYDNCTDCVLAWLKQEAET